MSRDGAETKDRGIARLVGDVAEGVSSLVSEHLALARMELAQDLKAFGADAARIAVFAPFIFVGYLLLCGALAAFIGRSLGLDAGLAIVGGANLLAGGAGVAVAASRMRKRQLLDGSREEIAKSAEVLKALEASRTLERQHGQ